MLCERPMATSVSECQAMIATADRSGRKLMVGQVCRFTPGFALARALVEGGRIGDLYFVESEYAHDYAKVPGSGAGGWTRCGNGSLPGRRVSRGGPPPLGCGRWRSAYALSNRKCLTGWPVDDCTAALYRFKSGANGKVLCAIAASAPRPCGERILGTRGTIIRDNTSPSIQLATDEHPQVRELHDPAGNRG